MPQSGIKALDDEIRRILTQLADYRMPFGKFGPKEFPPRGLLIYELPYEYLRFFERQGYPSGSLGQLMKFVHDVKRDGAEAIFDALRKRNGPVSLRKPRRKSYSFDE